MTTLRELAQAAKRKGTRRAWAALDAALGLDYGGADARAADAILAAIDAERERPWFPIETAPKGEWVLAWAARGTYGTAAPCVLVTRRDAWGWAEFDGGAVEPTHWQPLPAPPEVTAQREGAEGDE